MFNSNLAVMGITPETGAELESVTKLDIEKEDVVVDRRVLLQEEEARDKAIAHYNQLLNKTHKQEAPIK